MLVVYEIVMDAATEFHHSNIKLPFELERRLSLVIVTPRMHGIHHSIVERESNANWSVVFSCWDRLHRTLRLDVPHDAVVIGVPAYRSPGELTFGKLLALPFRRQRAWWRLPDGRYPERRLTGPPDRLAA
jgi:sterol desaturase/sphingolipid hydroxylase (fatty acid hydroxylase superfamily)